jgi:hypothetical protein
MKTKNTSPTIPMTELEEVGNPSRRHFFQMAGGLAVAGTLLAACHKDKNNGNGGVNLGSGDTGVLNYAYALEQLEAAFYIQVINSQYAGITSDEVALLTDIRDHEVAHREFFKAALGSGAIQGLTVNFSAIDFSSRASVLGAAQTFEDLGVSAYNGAGRLIVSAEFLTIAGKIVSVEARHAAYIRDLLGANTFASNVDTNGLDYKNTPAYVLNAASAYLSTKLDASNLPNR